MSPSPATPELLFREHSSTRRALGQSVGRWQKMPPRGIWLVNAHPKSGTHLVRNIMLHLSGNSVHQQFVYARDLAAELKTGRSPCIYVGHVSFPALTQMQADISNLNIILLVRHPCAVALAVARAFYDVNTTRADYLYARQHKSFEEIVRMVATGYDCEGFRHGPLAESFRAMTIPWLSRAKFVLRFEEIGAKMQRSDAELLGFFAPLIEGVVGEVPQDAAARLRAAAAPEISATYSRTKDTAYDHMTPEDVLSLAPDWAAQGLRQVSARLGY